MRSWVPLRAGYLLAGLLLGSACGERLQTVEPGPSLGAPCAEAESTPPEAAPVQVKLKVHRGQGVSAEEVQGQLGALARYYLPWGVTFVTQGHEVLVPSRALLTATGEAVEKALWEADINPNGPASAVSAEALQAVSVKAALGPLREAVKEADGTVHLWVLREIATHEAAARRALSDVSGLAVSPFGDEEAGQLREALSLESGFAPLMVLGLDGGPGRAPGEVELTLAHELGHAAGLGHVREPSNIMFSGAFRCVPEVSVDQLEALRRLQARVP